MSGLDPDYSKRDLWDAIENGEEIEWTAKVQIMQPEEADAQKLGFDPFSACEVWPRDQFPVGVERRQCSHSLRLHFLPSLVTSGVDLLATFCESERRRVQS